jgi:uncharacterized 2Fe-2S/4Fe-4S cluster protein (DUF4445 family)
MSDRYTITLKPLNVSFEVAHGTALQDVLFAHGVEFPCGGRKRCNGCKVKVLSGTFPVTPEQEHMLSAQELSSGWRLACCGTAIGDLEIELAQWEASVLTDNSSFPFKPRDGYGIAIDIGTTTIVAQLLDLSNGNVLAVQTALNSQARFGADIMERINFAITPGNKADLGAVLRDQIGSLLAGLTDGARIPRKEIRDVILVGNTVMQHFICNFNLTPLSHVPFEPVENSYATRPLSPADLGWDHSDPVSIRFLPSLGGFVGSDILAGILATGMYKRTKYSCLIDLGTNGEIVVGNKDRLLCASTAAGPAFEGARISMGMRAATGAISAVIETNGSYTCSVIGGGTPRGVCGSGLVDAVSVGLNRGIILPSGRFSDEESAWELHSPVSISQADIRELQLAKGAIAAGISILIGTIGTSADDIAQIHLAGAFGNYINRESARAIGLLPFTAQKVNPAGNTALLGAKRMLFSDGEGEIQRIQKIVEHIPLSSNSEFMQIFTNEMLFPGE